MQRSRITDLKGIIYILILAGGLLTACAITAAGIWLTIA